MALIPTDEMLKQLRCSDCSKYLSVLPVKVYKNNKIKCGRCCQQNDQGVISLYQMIVKNYLFKCVNRYDGCNKLLSVSEVLDHEAACKGVKFNGCPKSCKRFAGTSFEILKHCEEFHSESVLKTNKFFVKTTQDVTESFLYCYNNAIFIILVKYSEVHETLLLKAVALKRGLSVKQQFSIKSIDDTKLNYKTELKPCPFPIFAYGRNSLKKIDQEDYYKIKISLATNPGQVKCKLRLYFSDEFVSDAFEAPLQNKEKPMVNQCIQTVPLEDIPTIKLTADFQKEYPDYLLSPCGSALVSKKNPTEDRINLTCSNCNEFTGGNVFNCANNKHLMCWDCQAWCSVCNCPGSGWNSRISSVNELLRFPCRWKCQTLFSGERIMEHEKNCDRRPLVNCPLGSCREELKYSLLPTHFLFHNDLDVCMDNFSIVPYLKSKSGYTGAVYVVKNGYFFVMSWVKIYDVFNIGFTPCQEDVGGEIALIFENVYRKYDGDTIEITLSQNPRLFLNMEKSKSVPFRVNIRQRGFVGRGRGKRGNGNPRRGGRRPSNA